MSDQSPFSFAEEEPSEAKPKRRFAPPPEAAPPAASQPPAPSPAPSPATAPSSVRPSSVAADPDSDIKPGSRKDLWHCPHCGTGNKPERTTCRTCSKSPSEPVIVPWHRQPLKLGGVIAGAVVVLVVLVFAMRSDVAWREPGPAQIDRRLRSGGSPSGVTDTMSGNRVFIPDTRAAISGRLLLGKQIQLGYVVVLALGAAATDEATFAAMKASISGHSVNVEGGDAQALILIRSDELPSTRGAWVSIAGDIGQLTENGQLHDDNGIGPVMRPTKIAVRTTP